MLSTHGTPQLASGQPKPLCSDGISAPGRSSLPPRPLTTGAVRAASMGPPAVNQMWSGVNPSPNGLSLAAASTTNQMFKRPPLPLPPLPQRTPTPTLGASVNQPYPLSLPARPSPLLTFRPEAIEPQSSLPAARAAVRASLPPQLGKRKDRDDRDELDGSDGEGDSSHGDRSSEEADIKPVIRSSTVMSDRKPNVPVPVLPIPLPSKRYKKNLKSRGTLIPAEQLPTYPLPPLPTINDQELAKQVFTHSSLFTKPRDRFEDPADAPAKHYEKLEHVGDSILGMVVTTWLHELKPRLTCGAATKLKAHLVSNATLSHISGNYNFPQRLNGDPELLPVLRASTDVRAAMVEAYIAALYFSYPPEERTSVALGVIDGWLREMYEPLMDFFYEYMSKENEQHRLACEAGIDGTVILLSDEEMAKIDVAATGMANLITMYCNKQDRELAWEYEKFETNIGALWKVKCVVDGIELGDATRANKKQAKNVAAWEGAKKLGVTPA